MPALGPSDTKVILKQLVDLGLNDEIYVNHLHHAGHRIKPMLSYDKYVGNYQPDGRNVIPHRKLEWMLRTYREWGLPPGRTDVLYALAKACELGMS